jgi:hypothetical protein
MVFGSERCAICHLLNLNDTESYSLSRLFFQCEYLLHVASYNGNTGPCSRLEIWSMSEGAQKRSDSIQDHRFTKKGPPRRDTLALADIMQYTVRCVVQRAFQDCCSNPKVSGNVRAKACQPPTRWQTVGGLWCRVKLMFCERSYLLHPQFIRPVHMQDPS